MNKGFVVKMMQAKQLEYQALKEILPEPIVNRISKLEQEFLEIARECVMSGMMNEGVGHTQSKSNGKAKTRKINIE